MLTGKLSVVGAVVVVCRCGLIVLVFVVLVVVCRQTCFEKFCIVAFLREGEWEKRSVFVAVVVVSLCRGRRSGLRRLVRRVSAKSFFKISR